MLPRMLGKHTKMQARRKHVTQHHSRHPPLLSQKVCLPLSVVHVFPQSISRMHAVRLALLT